MSIIIRILFVLLAILLMAISVLFSGLVLHLISPEQIGLPLWLIQQISPILESDLQTRLIAGGISAVVFILGAVLIYFSLRRVFQGEPYLLVKQDELGKIEIAESCVSRLVDYETQLLGGVIEATTHIKDKRSGIQINSNVIVASQTKIDELGQNIQNRIKTEMRDKLGLSVSKIAVKTKIQELET